MDIIIRPLGPELLEDYLYFFDNVAFTDHPEWAWCYCTYYHLGKDDQKRLDAQSGGEWTRDIPRKLAIDLINTGKLRGYLAYTDGQVVGWCNASDKKNYIKLCENRDIWDDGGDLPVISITCFTIAPSFRRMGIASALLDRVIYDAASEGYNVLEAYPLTGERDCFMHYHGHPGMYEKKGFTLHKDLEGYSIYKKIL